MVAAIPLMGTEFEFTDILSDGKALRIKGVPDRHGRGKGLDDSGAGMNYMDGGSIIFALSDFPVGFDVRSLSGKHVKDVRDGVTRRIGDEVALDGLAVEVRLVKL